MLAAISAIGLLSSAAASTGIAQVCGYGIIEPPEECDDGAWSSANPF